MPAHMLVKANDEACRSEAIPSTSSATLDQASCHEAHDREQNGPMTLPQPAPDHERHVSYEIRRGVPSSVL